MNRMVVLVALSTWLAFTAPAFAAWTEWPVVGQVGKVGLCVLQDAGKITASLVKHTTDFGTETLVTLRDCLTFVVDTVTPGPSEGSEEPHE